MHELECLHRLITTALFWYFKKFSVLLHPLFTRSILLLVLSIHTYIQNSKKEFLVQFAFANRSFHMWIMRTGYYRMIDTSRLLLDVTNEDAISTASNKKNPLFIPITENNSTFGQMEWIIEPYCQVRIFHYYLSPRSLIQVNNLNNVPLNIFRIYSFHHVTIAPIFFIVFYTIMCCKMLSRWKLGKRELGRDCWNVLNLNQYH